MNLPDWNERYRLHPSSEEATALVVEWAAGLKAGKALDLACGAGRNSGYLAVRGWEVTAVDGASVGIDLLRSRHPLVRARVADLEAGDFAIEADRWDLILSCYYLQRDLFPAMKAGVRPGGYILAIAHIPGPEEEANFKRGAPGELRGFFADWEIQHDYEGPSRDPAHRRPVAEIVARKPRSSASFGGNPLFS